MIPIRHNPLLFRYVLLAGADICAKALGFSVSVVVIRFFGPSGFGEVNFATTIVTYALMFGTLGLDVYSVRRLARSPQSLGSLLGTTVVLRLLLGATAYLALLALAALMPALRDVFGTVCLFGLTLFTTALSLTWVAEGLQKTHVLALANLGIQLLWLVFVAAALAWGAGLWAVPLAQVLGEGVVAVGLYAWVTKRFGRPRFLLPGQRWTDILRQSAPIGGGRVMRAIALGSDLLLLGFLVSRTELGWYAGAFKLFLVSTSLGALYFVVLFPRMARAAAEPVSTLAQELHASIGRVLLAAAPFAAVLALFAAPLLQTLFGPSFTAAAPSFQVLLVALLVNLTGNHFRNALVAQGRQRLDFGVTAAASAVHVVSKALLIPVLGILGSALGTLVGEITLMVLGWRATRLGHEATGGQLAETDRGDGTQPRLDPLST